MDYVDAISKLKGLEKLGIKFRIENTRDLLDLSGFSYDGLVIHVGGTNGKGSTSTALAKCLEASGLKVGLYTSPDIFSLTERITVNGEEITDDELAQLTSKIMTHIESMSEPPTFFEATTVIALLHFQRCNVDAMVCEAGMGGRLDSTNAIHAKYTIITNVSMDHMEYLGDTVEQIASEKAGLISPNSNLITCARGPALKVLIEKAKGNGSQVIVAGDDFKIDDVRSTLDGTEFTLVYAGEKIHLTSPMAGKFQAENLAQAAVCARLCGIGWEHISFGMSLAKMPARLELISRKPTVIVDAAHNPDGIERGMEFIKGLKGHDRIIVVCGFSKDKDYKSMLEKLSGASALIATDYGGQRGLDPKVIGELMDAIVIDDPKEALQKAKDMASEKGIVYLVGSIFLAAKVLKAQGRFMD